MDALPIERKNFFFYCGALLTITLLSISLLPNCCVNIDLACNFPVYISNSYIPGFVILFFRDYLVR